MAAPVPDLERLLALSTDDWSAVLAAALPVLRGLGEDQRDQSVDRVVATPPARLVAGRPRELVATLVRRPGVWPPVATALDEQVLGRLATDAPDDGPDPDLLARAARTRDAEARADAANARAAGLRERLEDARREAEGATARAEAAERRADEADADRRAARTALRELRAELDVARQEAARAVARERRRAEGRDARERDELRRARRRLGELEEELAALRARLAAAEATVTTSGARARVDAATPVHDPDAASSGRRGRPSRLPEGITAGTRDAAAWLVGAGVPLLVDGYNVTRTHLPDRSLRDQRAWLEDRLAALARRRSVPVTIVWDSGVGASTRRSRAGVTVRYTEQDMTADDELVLHVRTLLGRDDPAVVVTDDVELRARLSALGVDLLDTTSFTWLL